MTHASITMRGCVAYIHDPDLTLTYDLKVFVFSSNPTGNFCLLWHWLTIFGHVSITMRGCVKYIQDPERMLTFDLMVKFVGFMTWLFVQATAFLSFDSLIMISMCCIHTWPWTSLSKLYFNHEFESGKIVFALWHKHTKFWHMVVSPWENMLCTFLTFVWPWPLTYMCRGYP